MVGLHVLHEIWNLKYNLWMIECVFLNHYLHKLLLTSCIITDN